MILNKEVISPKVLENFVPLLDEVGQDFVARVHKKIERTGQNKWTTDLSQELFKYALECKSDFQLPSVGSVEVGALFLSSILLLFFDFVLHSRELSAVRGAARSDAGLHRSRSATFH